MYGDGGGTLFQQVFDRITIESVREALGEAIGRRVSDIRELAGV